jgi:alpha-ketoglutarate-dependent taurine dioxygenase
MEIVPLGPGFAAELRGVTLAEIAADDAAYKEARAALEQHSVIVFRGQEVTDEAQLAFSRRFGPLEITKVGSLGTGTNLVILSTIDENGNVVPADHRLALRNNAEQAAAQKLLGELMDAATAPGVSYVHSWRKGDVVMWDNRATMHRGRPWPAHEARLMVRTTISATEADGLESVRLPSRQAAE